MNNPTQQMNVPFENTDPVVCKKCNGKYFTQALALRKASKLLTGQDKDSYVPIPVFACIECNHVNQEFQPQEIQSL